MNLIPQAVRDGFGRMLGPLAAWFIRMRVRPNVLTTLGTVIVVGSAMSFALGKTRWGGFLLLLSGVFDMVDGRVAREGGMTTTFGAFYDSTLDRVGEAALFTGIAVYFLQGGVPPERLTAAVLGCIVGLAASLLVSYTRARQGEARRDARGVGGRLHDPHRWRRKRAVWRRAADRLAHADGDDPSREADRKACAEDSRVPAPGAAHRLGVRGVGSDS